MKKALIWDDFPMSNIGGPMGYCYNIHEYLKDHPTKQITFLSDLLPERERGTWGNPPMPKSARKLQLHRILRGLHLYGIYGKVGDVKNTLKAYLFEHYRTGCKIIPATLNLNEYDIIHFHWTKHLAIFKRAHPEYKGKTMLTSHSPCPISVEVFSEENWARIFWPIEFSRECHTYDEADYIMFPCEGAREPYEKYGKMKRTFANNNHKFHYNPSAILDLKVDSGKIQKFSELSIPANAFVITYFGRHISVKGYDILKQVGHRLLNKYPHLYFLCAGKGEIQPLNHPRWIELGFIHNANELMSQSSLYILPNRETYFDLVTLEILRAGIPVILSNTGGNKYFHHFLSEELMGMDFFDINDIDDLIVKVENVIKQKSVEPAKYMEKKVANRNLFINNFTIDKFVERYINLINSL
uniref:glycosyltransferase family 4 protein n=1 Tax=Bacteroides fragilis TaxID=817 RepID=UPI003561330B